MFRFNNPDEVRKQRDRATAKSNLRLSVTAAELEAENGGVSPATRPDSPTSSGELPDVDWNFAKREAALARLGLDPALDNLPDEDLNKLYEKITRVKSMRDNNSRRPESSLSQADDVWSESGRPISSDVMTDDTSVDAGPSHDSPDAEGVLKETQDQLESHKAEFESRLQSIAEAESIETEELRAEKEHMEYQLKLVKAHMKRLIDAKARGGLDNEVPLLEPTIFTGRQLRIIRKVLDKWRAHRAISMAEVILSNAVYLKEANVIRYVNDYVTSCFSLKSTLVKS